MSRPMNKCIAVLATAVATLGFSAPLFAQNASSLDELYEQAKRERSAATAERRQREQEFRAARNNQRQLVSDLKARVSSENARSENLKAQFDANELTLTEMQETLRIRVGDMGELFGVVRQMAGDAKGLIDSSLVSAQYPGRSDLLQRLAEAKALPSIDDLHELRLLLQHEMTESGKVVRFNTGIVDSGGSPLDAEVVRVGVFNLITDDKFLAYNLDTGTVYELARQPKARFRTMASGLYDANDGIHAMAVDPTFGSLLSLLIQAPSVKERIDQGGFVGYVIIALGIAGLLIGLWRMIALGGASAKVRSQLKSDTPNENNALGRILAVYDKNRETDTETLELKLDEAILKETPRLEKWQGAIKVIAAVAPLLGLLGTVTGMILTFQQITLFGTGDPKLMAGGISQALVTTMLGLFVAIPMVLLHSLVAGSSKNLIEILEEQSAGIIASQSEREA